MKEQKIQDYGTDGSSIYRTGVHSYEVRTSHGTGKGATVAEALKDLADKQVEVESKANDASLNIDSEYVKQEPVEKPKKRKSSKKKKQAD